MSAAPRVLVVESSGAPREHVAAAAAALGGVCDVRRVDVGRIGQAGGVAARALEFLLGEGEARRLGRELSTFAPDVAIGFEPGAVAALVDARDAVGQASAAAVIAVVPELAPGRAWAVDADRLLVVDDEAAVALAELGLDGSRAVVGGTLVEAARTVMAREPREAARKRVQDKGVVVLVDARPLGADALAQVIPQLALLEGVVALFDAADDAELAALLRKKVPGLGLRAKLFGATANAPGLWRAADLVLTRARPAGVARAIAAGAGVIAYEPTGPDEPEARGLVDRGLGLTARTVTLLAGVLAPVVRDDPARRAMTREAELRGAGGGDALVALVLGVARERASVLAETFAAARERTLRAARKVDEATRARGAATEVEDLGGDLDAEIAADLGLPTDGASPPPSARSRRDTEAVLQEMKRREARESVNDELLALKRRMEADKKR